MSDNQQTGSRRQWLSRCSSGFGLAALAALHCRESNAATWGIPGGKAKNVILGYTSGGVSHVDSFDPKPRLNQDHGAPMPLNVERTQFNNNGQIFGSPFKFAQHGESGLAISDMF